MNDEERLRRKYRRLDGLSVEPVVRQVEPVLRQIEPVQTGVLSVLQNYSALFEPVSLRALERAQLASLEKKQKSVANIMVMGAADFRTRYEKRIRPGLFHAGVYSGSPTDREGMRYSGQIFDTHLGTGIGTALWPSGILCAAYTPEGIASMRVFPLPKILPTETQFAGFPEVQSLKRFLTKFFAHGGSLFLLGSDERTERTYLEFIQKQLRYPHIPSQRLFTDHEAMESHVQAAFFFPGKAIGEAHNQLIFVGNRDKGNDDAKWLRTLFSGK